MEKYKRRFPGIRWKIKYDPRLQPAVRNSAALVEDGMLETAIQPSVALFAETLWNPRRKNEDLLDLALSPYYKNELL